MANKASKNKQHYNLICGTLLLASMDNENISSVTLNAIVPSDIKHINVDTLGRAQQALQANFMQRMKDSPDMPQIVDVVIASISYLGHMTQEQFNKAPEGLELVERAPEDSAVAPVSDDPFQ